MNIDNTHFIGLKGTGMSGLAQILKAKGARLSGSDQAACFPTDRVLGQAGIFCQAGFAAEHIPSDTELVIYSAAYNETNPEFAEALRRKLPMLSYPQAVGELSRDYHSIGVAGMHGKSTITAMLALALIDLGKDPTVILGTNIPQMDNNNARLGRSEFLLAETCEYRRHFLHFHPQALIFSNLEEEHMDYFRDLADVKKAFLEYASKLPRDGLLIYNGDDQHLVELTAKLPANLQKISYGFTEACTFRAERQQDLKSFVLWQGSKKLGEFKLQIPGQHNVSNALSVIALCLALFSEAETLSVLKKSLSEFRGTERRLEYKGEVKGVRVYDDFAHHPTEIKASLAALRETYPKAKIRVVFMSHTFSRTARFLADFAQSFKQADQVIINKIFASAREQQGKVDGRALAEAIKKYTPDTLYLAEFSETFAYLRAHMKAGEILVTMGAGTNYVIGSEFLGQSHAT